jgi:hypothetical protein
MEPPENTDQAGFLYDQVFVRDKYKKTTGIVSKKANDDPEESAFVKPDSFVSRYQLPVKKDQAIGRDDETRHCRNDAVIGIDPIAVAKRDCRRIINTSEAAGTVFSGIGYSSCKKVWMRITNDNTILITYTE